MEASYQHSLHQRVLKQRNRLAVASIILAILAAVFGLLTVSRDREVVLQPILRSPLAISSSGVSRDYLEAVTRDTAVLVLDRSPQNLEYWMNSVLNITAPSAQGRVKGDLLKIVDEQRGSSISQFFTIQAMDLNTKELTSDVTGDLHTIVGSKEVSKEHRTFRFTWQYSGVSLQLIGFGMVTTDKDQQR